MTEPMYVFHGYRLPEGTDLLDLAAQLRALAAPVREAIELQEVAHHVSRIMDEADLNGQERRPAVIFDAVQAHAAHAASVLNGHLGCSLPTLTVTVGDDPETGRLYAVASFQHEEYAAALADAGFGEWFPYWDEVEAEQTRPPGISTAEWTSRAAVWERVLRGATPEAIDGLFTITMGNSMPDMNMVNRAEDIFALLPELDDRVVAALNGYASGRVFTSPEEFFEFQASIPGHIAHLKESLKPITLEDLVGSVS